jgi:glycosyltransferase involved in cell wall biosynthesis
MKSIAIDCQKLDFLYCGLGQFCSHLANALESIPHPMLTFDFLITQYADCSQMPTTAQYKHLTNISRHLPKIGAPRADLWHMTHQDAPYFPRSHRIPMLLTVHDLNFLRTKPSKTIARRLRALQKRVNRATHIATISEATKQDLLAYCPTDTPISVIYNGTQLAQPGAQAPTFAENKPFLFAIGDITEKKNFHSLLALLKELPDHQYILAGRNTTAYAKHIRIQADDLGVAHQLIMPGIVSNSDKTWLYQNCDVFCAPSLAEGFGLPVAEALQAGAPLLLSDIPAHHEIAGQWGTFLPHHADSTTMLAAYQQCKQTADAQTKADQSALQKHLARFSWSHCAEQYLNLYQQLLEQ